MMPTKKIVLVFIFALSSMIFYCQENSIGLDGIRKNAISVSVLGTTGALGLTYERVLSKILTAEVGVGYPGVGLGVKVYPFSIKQNKMMFNTGASVVLMYDFGAGGQIFYVPIGLGYFGSKRFNFGIDLGPAMLMEDGYDNEFGIWGNLKLGMRF